MSELRTKIIANGIKNLASFGYQSVTEASILTDQIYSAFFLSMLNDNLGKGFDGEINKLIAEIKNNHGTT